MRARERWFAAALLLWIAGPAHAATYTVANTNDSGAGSLRAAIASVNANPPGPHRIVFAIPATGVQTIHLLTPLDPIVNPVAIDGTTQPGYNSNNAARVVELDGTGSSVALILNGAHSSVKGIAFNRFPSNALNVSADGCTVQACYMGTNANGTAASPNNGIGLYVNGMDNVIGGRGPARRNVISGNGSAGVVFTSASLRDTLVGNYIGTDATGFVAIPNGQDGVDTGGAGNLLLDFNLISGNTLDGIQVDHESVPDPSSAVQIYRNLIGADVTGMNKLANHQTGVRVLGSFTTIGSPGLGNTISGNGEYGIYVDGSLSSTNWIWGNKIGVSSDGSLPLGNSKDGIFLDHTVTNVIGDNISGGFGNLIGSNGGYGIRIEGAGTSDHIITGNAIGTSFNGALALGNAQAGIYTASDRALIGNADADLGNLVAHNNGGVWIAGNQNTVRGNAVFANGPGLGIDLLEPATGVTVNDSLDNDIGANQLQNYPVLTSVTQLSDQVRLQGRLASAPNKAFDVDFYSGRQCGSSGYGEGESYLGTVVVNTSVAGNTTFDVTFPLSSVVGFVFTCTATDEVQRSTSEFSPCGSMSTPTDAPEMIAQAYFLGPSRPSPARTTAFLPFSLPVASSVHVRAYDVSGRLVGSLVDGALPGGWHQAEWPVGSVAAGVYFVRLEARANDGSGRHFQASRTVVVVR